MSVYDLYRPFVTLHQSSKPKLKSYFSLLERKPHLDSDIYDWYQENYRFVVSHHACTFIRLFASLSPTPSPTALKALATIYKFMIIESSLYVFLVVGSHTAESCLNWSHCCHVALGK